MSTFEISNTLLIVSGGGKSYVFVEWRRKKVIIEGVCPPVPTPLLAVAYEESNYWRGGGRAGFYATVVNKSYFLRLLRIPPAVEKPVVHERYQLSKSYSSYLTVRVDFTEFCTSCFFFSHFKHV